MCWCCNKNKTIIDKLNSLLTEKQQLVFDAEHDPHEEHKNHSEYEQNGNNEDNEEGEIQHRIGYVAENLTSEYLKSVLTTREYLEICRRPVGNTFRYNGNKSLVSIRTTIAIKAYNHLITLLHFTRKELKLAKQYPTYLYYRRDDKLIRIINVKMTCLCKPESCISIGRKCPCLEPIAEYFCSTDCGCGCFAMESDQSCEGIEICSDGWTPDELYEIDHSPDKRVYPIDPLATLKIYVLKAITNKMKKNNFI